MTPAPAPDPRNRYCDRLGLTPPDLTAAVTRRDVKLAHLMVMALLEAGAPLSLEAIAGRLERLPLPSRLGGAGLRAALRRAWHGQSPIVRDTVDGLYYLDVLNHFEIRRTPGVAPEAGVRWPRAACSATSRPTPGVSWTWAGMPPSRSGGAQMHARAHATAWRARRA